MTVSMLHMAIARSMRELGLPVQLEYNEGYFSVDLAMFLPPSAPGGQTRKVRLSQGSTACWEGCMTVDSASLCSLSYCWQQR